MGAWLVALLWSRAEEEDGFCPLEIVESYAGPEVVTGLVDVGLLAREEKDGIHGVHILRFELWNETKAAIDARLQRDRTRKGKPVPRGIQPESDRNPNGFHVDSNRNPIGIQVDSTRNGSPSHEIIQKTAVISDRNPIGIRSDSVGLPGNGTGSGNGSGESAREGRAERAVRPDDPITDEMRQLASLCSVQDIDGAWKKFCGHYAARVLHVAGKWQMWCVNEAKTERVARERRRSSAPPEGENPYDGPRIRADRARRNREWEDAKLTAEPAPIGALLAALERGEK